jgi:hypothetical protein
VLEELTDVVELIQEGQDYCTECGLVMCSQATKCVMIQLQCTYTPAIL